MEEERKDSAMNLEKCSAGKLNFNAPLLSTRRPVGMKRLEMPRASASASASSLRLSRDLSSTVKIPFSWEQTPGKPKVDADGDHHVHNHINHIDDLDFIPPPPPKLPPSRWRDKEEDFKEDDCYCKEHEKDDHESDAAIDVFSLGQSVEDLDEPGEAVEMFGFEGLEVGDYYYYHRDRGGGGGGGSHSPNFIIQRFLPDAKALAAAAASGHETASGGGGAGFSRAISVRRRSWSHPTTITKGCGLHDIFFPWRNIKPKPCGTKNPVVLAAELRQKPRDQCTRRDK